MHTSCPWREVSYNSSSTECSQCPDDGALSGEVRCENHSVCVCVCVYSALTNLTTKATRYLSLTKSEKASLVRNTSQINHSFNKLMHTLTDGNGHIKGKNTIMAKH